MEVIGSATQSRLRKIPPIINENSIESSPEK